MEETWICLNAEEKEATVELKKKKKKGQKQALEWARLQALVEG